MKKLLLALSLALAPLSAAAQTDAGDGDGAGLTAEANAGEGDTLPWLTWVAVGVVGLVLAVSALSSALSSPSDQEAGFLASTRRGRVAGGLFLRIAYEQDGQAKVGYVRRLAERGATLLVEERPERGTALSLQLGSLASFPRLATTALARVQKAERRAAGGWYEVDLQLTVSAEDRAALSAYLEFLAGGHHGMPHGAQGSAPGHA